MSWLKRFVSKIINLVTKGKFEDPSAKKLLMAIPSAAAAAGSGTLTADIEKVLNFTLFERNQAEIDFNRTASSPLLSKAFCDKIAEEYEKWYKTLHAGVMPPNAVGLAALQTGLRIAGFSKWGVAFAAYWQTTIWMPTGVYVGGVATNAIAQGALLQVDIDNLIRTGSKDIPEFANRIGDLLHKYTLNLTVQAGITVAPYTKVEKVM
jgi:hypothetical protein